MIRCSASDLATLYARCGNYVEAIGITGRIDTAGMDDSERYRYHNALYTIYEGMSLVAIDEADRSEYRQRLAAERASGGAVHAFGVRAGGDHAHRGRRQRCAAAAALDAARSSSRANACAGDMGIYSVAQSHPQYGA